MAYLYLINSSLESTAFKQLLIDNQTEFNCLFLKNGLEYSTDIAVIEFDKAQSKNIRKLLDAQRVDYVYSDNRLCIPQLTVFDMDSTLIPIEVIDELAAYAGKKPEVSEVTELAMQGQLDFNQSLTQRVKHLAGLDEKVIKDLADKLEFNPGVKKFCQYLLLNGGKLAIASGGFEPFARALQRQVDFDFIRANQLEITDNQLTGGVIGTIINAEEKAKAIEEWSQKLEIDIDKTMAVGDGANDLLMLQKAAIGIAYKAKPKVNQSAQSVLRYSSMAALIDLFECAKEFESIA